MANEFNRVILNNFGTSTSTVYTVPSGKKSVIIGMMVSNKLEEAIRVTVNVAGAAFVHRVVIPRGSSISLLDGKLVMNAGDTITIISDNANSGDVIVSFMEMS